MVAIHALHGLALDVGAKRQGSRARRARGLRFGLYACGWDLVTLPLGLALVAILEGPRAALRNGAVRRDGAGARCARLSARRASARRSPGGCRRALCGADRGARRW